MPINYLELQPQVSEYCRQAGKQIASRPEKVATAIALLKRLASEVQEGEHKSLSAQISKSAVKRCALPAHESLDGVFPIQTETEPYSLLASDGSQITSSHHDILPLSLVNTATVYMQPGSALAPQVKISTEFIRAQDGTIATEFLPERWVNTARDVRELQVLANFPLTSDYPLIALSDGPLELFQEPRSGETHQILFQDYLASLSALCRNEYICAGYTDKPRADLIVKLLELVFRAEPRHDISGITDAHIFSQLLPPAARSSVFTLFSPSSNAYRDEIALHFFYLNAGSLTRPWIVRVEIPSCVAARVSAITLLQHALIDQCALLGQRPYPYILHRAHEEAVVHFEERENVMQLLTHTLTQMGVDTGAQSNKLNAKELRPRTRLK